MNEKATVYDYARICKFYDDCKICPLGDAACHYLISDHPDKANEIILNWCKEHPVETRQDRFLKMFPKAEIKNNVVALCPNRVESNFHCRFGEDCDVCYVKYWLAEVYENDI